jgi:F0F1-type ATP synthase delta subunit
MKAKEKMLSITKAVKAANSSIKREMGVISLSGRMEMLPDAQTKYELASAIKELEATLKEARKL